MKGGWWKEDRVVPEASVFAQPCSLCADREEAVAEAGDLSLIALMAHAGCDELAFLAVVMPAGLLAEGVMRVSELLEPLLEELGPSVGVKDAFGETDDEVPEGTNGSVPRGVNGRQRCGAGVGREGRGGVMPCDAGAAEGRGAMAAVVGARRDELVQASGKLGVLFRHRVNRGDEALELVIG